jgi:hypothetical protein
MKKLLRPRHVAWAAVFLAVPLIAIFLIARHRSPATSPEQTPNTATSSAASDQTPPGSWWKIPEQDLEISADAAARLKDLAAVGYLGGYRSAPSRIGVTLHDPGRASPGYNLFVSGHAPEAALIDMCGRVVHTWGHAAPTGYQVRPDRNFWRRVWLLPDGSLLAIFDPYGMIKLDKDSNLLWATDVSNHIHHDLFVTDSNLIYTLGKRHRKIPSLDPKMTFGEDLVLVLDQDGMILERHSILEAFENSPFEDEIKASIRESLRHATGDVWEDFHANTIEVLDGSLADLDPVFQAGNVVSCSPHNGNVFIIDLRSASVVWNWFGPWVRIHEPQVLPGGRLLLFHNNGYRDTGNTPVSQAVEYDLLARKLRWTYDGSPRNPETRFFSGTSSTVQRLPNGNTLIVVTEAGRAIEVTEHKAVVWEFFNPHRAGKDFDLIASLFQLERVACAGAARWLGESASTDCVCPDPAG